MVWLHILRVISRIVLSILHCMTCRYSVYVLFTRLRAIFIYSPLVTMSQNRTICFLSYALVPKLYWLFIDPNLHLYNHDQLSRFGEHLDGTPLGASRDRVNSRIPLRLENLFTKCPSVLHTGNVAAVTNVLFDFSKASRIRQALFPRSRQLLSWSFVRLVSRLFCFP